VTSVHEGVHHLHNIVLVPVVARIELCVCVCV
jgi:hypothetical protein